MASSYALADFVGNGTLKEIIDSLVADGWDDVPTIKMMSSEDMEALNLTQQQRDALEIRSYLHDRALMEYADKLEASGKTLAELIGESPTALASQFGMKRGHVARFVDRSVACGIRMPPSLSLPASRRTRSTVSTVSSKDSQPEEPDSARPAKNPSPPRDDPSKKETKGIVASAPAVPKLCGLIPPLRVDENVTPIEVLEKISVQRVTPEHKRGSSIDGWSIDSGVALPPPIKAADLWSRRPALLFIMRRPGCVMCRAEAHQLYARKPIFDAMGVHLVAVLGEYMEAEVRAFWPRYWGGMVVVDKNREFFQALGGGRLLKDNLVTGFCFNAAARMNYKRAQTSGAEGNFVGEGLIKGGLYIIRAGKAGVAYQFVERNFGDWAPVEELLSVCSSFQPTVDKSQD
ncbi:uncharacterized protein LOC9656287 isoform X2 [Selaginella moellendorffii]|uniref:uncharacterized protein LOC9656287 isoform X2 n=1 Tax=Selaginella moellendorffii TaxID=88036 RepID=UPI000D1CBB74|nr:uncharacterized protein LOC9656287 isoform X2 [Selaginella moellendorffii]|eukprot:XP_024541399.1 uncharacterized protein LOC9656287 isoform X2 [Selaginella moellendorffii]